MERLNCAPCAHFPRFARDGSATMRWCALASMWSTSQADCCTCAIALGSRWWAVEDRSNDVAANNVLVVQVRAVRAISRSLPVPAARAL